MRGLRVKRRYAGPATGLARPRVLGVVQLALAYLSHAAPSLKTQAEGRSVRRKQSRVRIAAWKTSHYRTGGRIQPSASMVTAGDLEG